jgi:hypothetical protein
LLYVIGGGFPQGRVLPLFESSFYALKKRAIFIVKAKKIQAKAPSGFFRVIMICRGGRSIWTAAFLCLIAIGFGNILNFALVNNTQNKHV